MPFLSDEQIIDWFRGEKARYSHISHRCNTDIFNDHGGQYPYGTRLRAARANLLHHFERGHQRIKNSWQKRDQSSWPWGTN